MKKNIVSAEIDEERNIMIVTWKSLIDEEIFKECCLSQLEKINSETIMILNFKSVNGFFTNNINIWLIDIFLPKIKEMKLKLVIIIEPEKMNLKESFKNWLKIGKNISRDMIVISDIKEIIKN